LTFEWDEDKAEKNRRKHGIHFAEVLAVFDDPCAVEFFDQEHSSPAEARYAVIGLAASGLMYVVFTERGEGGIRLIHARKADSRMVKIYESKE
jgi:uncharacterized DUF497 family protein